MSYVELLQIYSQVRDSLSRTQIKKIDQIIEKMPEEKYTWLARQILHAADERPA